MRKRKGMIVCHCGYDRKNVTTFKSYASPEHIRKIALNELFRRAENENDRGHSDRLRKAAP